jgi:hypothetical protein
MVVAVDVVEVEEAAAATNDPCAPTALNSKSLHTNKHWTVHFLFKDPNYSAEKENTSLSPHTSAGID